MISRILIVLVFSNILEWQLSNALYSYGTSTRMRQKLVMMNWELYKDSKSKVQAIWPFRKHYSNHSSFQLAQVVYNIRRMYNRMIFLFFRVLDKFDTFSQYQHMDTLQEIQFLSYNIDNLIYAMEEWEDKHTRKKRITRMGWPNLRTRENPEERAKREKEERQKQKAYVERKKMLWSLRQGNSRDNLGRGQFQMKDISEEGFESDILNLK